MMNIFKAHIHKLPPFKEYWKRSFKRKQMAVIGHKSDMNVVHFARL